MNITVSVNPFLFAYKHSCSSMVQRQRAKLITLLASRQVFALLAARNTRCIDFLTSVQAPTVTIAKSFGLDVVSRSSPALVRLLVGGLNFFVSVQFLIRTHSSSKSFFFKFKNRITQWHDGLCGIICWKIFLWSAFSNGGNLLNWNTFVKSFTTAF